MTLNKIIEMGLVNDNTTIYVRGYGTYGMIVLACGNWYHDNVLDYVNNEIDSFTWQYDNSFYIDIMR